MQALSENCFRTVFEMAGDAIVIADGDSGRILRVNPQCLELVEFSEEELLALCVWELHPDEQRVTVRAELAAAKSSGPQAPLHCQLPGEFGYPVECELVIRRISDEGGDLLVCRYRDVSDRIRASEDIHLRNVAIASFNCGVTIADARQSDLPLIYVNRGFEDLTGYRAKEAIGRSCRFLQGNDREQEALEVLRAALRNGESCVVRLRNYRKDGSLFHNELHLSPVRNEKGELTHFVGIQIDVTERVRNRELLASSERRYRLLADSIDDLLLRRKPGGLLEYVSPAARGMLGRDPDPGTGENFLDWVHPEDREPLRRAERRVLNGEDVVATRLRLLHADGGEVWVEARESLSTPLEESSDPLLVSVCRDISLQLKAEKEMRIALEKEKELNEIKTRLISMVSHEFRTPMTSIRASTSLLRDFGARLSAEKTERHHQNIENALQRMEQMIDDVLFIGKSESGRLEIRLAPVDIYSYCHRLVESLEITEPEKRLVFDCDLECGVRVTVDENLLNHILINLLGNALKYSPVHGVVRFSACLQEGELVFEIADRGIGIPEADQVNLFEAFHRARNVSTIRGTGMGLSIARRSVDLLGGRLEFQSEEGEGTRFRVWIPAPVDNGGGEVKKGSGNQ